MADRDASTKLRICSNDVRTLNPCSMCKYPEVRKLMSIFTESEDQKRVWSENGRSRCVEKVKDLFKQKNKGSVSLG